MLRDRLFGTAGELQPDFDGSIRMNSESPFRISSMVLAVACVLCGASASPYFLALSSTHMSADEQLSVAADMLRVSLSEFQTSGQKAVAQSHQPTVASRSALFPAISLVPFAPVSHSTTASAVGFVTQQPISDRSEMTTRRDDIHSTSFGRSASQRALQAGSVPQFYAPVTVYPVTVNVDNSDIIREISRVHERLNSLSNAAGSAAHPEAPTPDASAAAPVEHTDVPQMGRKFEYKVHNEPTNEEPASLPVIEF